MLTIRWKNSRNKEQRTPRSDCRQSIMQQLATQLQRSVQLLHAHMHLEILQIGHFNSPILYSSHMILHRILQSFEHQITRNIWWKLGKFLSWAMLYNRLLFNFMYKHIYSTSKSSQREDCKQESGSICNINTKNGDKL